MKYNYSNKIVKVNRLVKLLGKYPRKRKIILCHGNFDVVHPGHIRHLNYAKSKADILIVSLTADKFIKKGTYKPYVPENLRANNLAALEMVDYVIIDKNYKPLKNIQLIKPNFFAKGFEYSSGGLPPATLEELTELKKFGGNMIFTPGDIVYSSSKLLNLSEPKINILKITDLMKKNKISFDQLISTIKKFKKIKIHVLGDTIVDTYTSTSLIGGNTKTPTPSVLFQGKTDYLGGAGIVAKHLKMAGARVKFTTVLGKDKLNKFVKKNLKQHKIVSNIIEDPIRPTTNKNTIVTGKYKMLKVDTLDNQPISEKTILKIIKLIKNDKSDAIIFSDFRHGIFNKISIPRFCLAIKKNIFKAADSQVATRWGNILDYKNFDLITPNEREARFSLADQDSGIGDLTRSMSYKNKYKNLILKLGEKGIFADGLEKKIEVHFSLPSLTQNIIDNNGSGDALLAYATLTLKSSNSLVMASIIGSIAAGLECELEGNIPIRAKDVIEKIENIRDESKYKIQ